MILVKKVAVILFVLAAGLIGFGYLPKPLAKRVTNGLLLFMLLGFAVRAGAYFLNL